MSSPGPARRHRDVGETKENTIRISKKIIATGVVLGAVGATALGGAAVASAAGSSADTPQGGIGISQDGAGGFSSTPLTDDELAGGGWQPTGN